MQFSIWRKPHRLELFMALHAGSSLFAEERQLDARKSDAKPPSSENSESWSEATLDSVSNLISVPSLKIGISRGVWA
jgi:hypothetical protein